VKEIHPKGILFLHLRMLRVKVAVVKEGHIRNNAGFNDDDREVHRSNVAKRCGKRENWPKNEVMSRRMKTDQSAHSPNVVCEKLLANHDRFLNFLAVRLGKREDAEDILQNAFVKGLQKASEIRDEESAVAWFYRLLRNAIIDHYRHSAAGQKALEAITHQTTDVDPSFDAELKKVVCDCVSEMVPLIKTEYAEMIRRVDLGGANLTSLANEMGISPGNARVRLHRARTALRNELENFCGKCAAEGCIDCSCSRKNASSCE